MSERFANLDAVMQRAVQIAARGIGRVEPNPPVGAIVVDDDLNLIGAGCHERFGGPHAEINALRMAGDGAVGATLVCTLEPCCHFGKTGPCTQAVIEAGIRRVVVALTDPAPHASGRGLAALRAAGLEVEAGRLAEAAARLTAPFLKLVTVGRPWVHAKWAMSLDGKIATRTGDSRWISGENSREIVHRLRGRMDAILVGSRTARLDDPLLTARPPGPRIATRVVLDRLAQLPLDSQLVRTIDEAPVLVAALESADPAKVRQLHDAGVEVLLLPEQPTAMATEEEAAGSPDPDALLVELGRRAMSNVLVEGGGALLGALFDRQLIDEVHVFVAPKFIGGAAAVTPMAGIGLEKVPRLDHLASLEVERSGSDVYLHGPLRERLRLASTGDTHL